MWTQTYSKRVKGLKAEQAWKVWTDVNQWNLWQDDIEFAKLTEEFKTGGKFVFKPKGGPELVLELTECVEGRSFTDLTRFPLAKMYDAHEIIVHDDEVELKCTLTMKGPLSFVWRKLVGEGVARGIPVQIEALIGRVKAAQ